MQGPFTLDGGGRVRTAGKGQPWVESLLVISDGSPITATPPLTRPGVVGVEAAATKPEAGCRLLGAAGHHRQRLAMSLVCGVRASMMD